jgi:hypothetical protein
MAVDADPSTEGIDTSASWDLAEEFEVSTNITAVGTPYLGYQMSIEFEDDILAFVPVGPTRITYTDLGNMLLNLVALDQDHDADGRPEIYAEAARYTGTTPDTGRANYVRFRCAAPGTTSLHLLTSSESTGSYTSTVDTLANFIPTVLQDATITCSSLPLPNAQPAPPAVGGSRTCPPQGKPGWSIGPIDCGSGSRPRCAALALAACTWSYGRLRLVRWRRRLG